MTLRPRSSRRSRLLLASLLAVPLAACSDLTQPDPIVNRYGAVALLGRNASATTAVANATAIFFEAYTTAVPNSAEQAVDQCEYAPVDTTTRPIRGVEQAGTAVGLAIGSQNVSLPYEPANFRYATPAGSPITYTAGEQVSVSVPGSSAFPAATVSVKLAEPIIPGPVAIPTTGNPLVITWNATNDATTAVRLSIKYAEPASATYANRQIFCSLKDDGRHEFTYASLAAFLASPNARRSMTITRYRTNEQRIDDRTLLHVATTVDTTVTFQ